MDQHLMLVPSLSCPAGCRYCFGPRQDGTVMSQDTLQAVIRWLRTYGGDGPIEITFHGGEPLTAGPGFYHMALPLLQAGLAPRPVRFAVQSNLWLLTDELCELFKEHEVSLGTSLDGPESINDAQRGRGYFQKTMAGIELAHSHGLSVGCICTFTAQSAEKASEVFDFFLDEGLEFSIHAAVPPLGRADNEYALSPEEHGQLLVDTLDRYLDNAEKLRISTLDAMCRSVSAGKGGICTFGDCLGHYLAVDPQGWLYPCQRFAGMETFRLGNVHDVPAKVDFENTAPWRALKDRQDRIEQACEECPHLAYCRGGCPYSVLAANNGVFDGELRDPHCPAYRRAFDEITDRAMAEVFSGENLAAVAEGVSDKYGLLRKGKLLRIMRGDLHPRDAARHARKVVAAAALAVSGTPESALHRLDRAGVITNPSAALGSLQALRRQLDTQSQEAFVNAYIHVTSACNLACAHCYAAAETPSAAASMAVEDVVSLVRQAADAGFAKAVITGGEPLVHPQRDALLDALAALRQEAQPVPAALRTNLACALTPTLAERLLSAADQVVVSVDGGPESHDAQRGPGSYDRTVANLRFLLDKANCQDRASTDQASPPAAQLVIAATLTPDQMEGPDGAAVRALGQELALPVRLKPVLPLGRGAALGIKPAFYNSLDEDDVTLTQGAQPVATCGLGTNLYLSPDGACYPCYALVDSRHYLGNALEEGLGQVLARNDAYRRVTVDTTAQCRACALRYLCGGYCRAWSESNDPEAPPTDCAALRKRAEAILCAALETLDINEETWRAAGLPAPGW